MRINDRDPAWMERGCSAAEAVRLVQSDHHVFLHGGCATSLPLEAALADWARSLEGVRVFQMHKDGPEVLADPSLEGHVRITSMFSGHGIRPAIAEGRADFMPVFLSDIPHMFRNGTIPLDVAIVQVSRPDAHGYCSLGTSVDVARQAVDSARIVIAEVNAQMPRTLGNSLVHLDEFDAFVVTDRPILERSVGKECPEADEIARNVAGLVPDMATLQVGIGAIPDAVLSQLFDKNELSLHTEMFSDGVVDLVRAGVITNRYKPRHQGRCVTSFVVGSHKVYDFIHDNPAVEFHPADYTNDTALIRRHERMTAINGALEVDLTGQVCADSIGTRIYSGIGGQMDFIRGAALAPGGKAIIALPSTAARGTVSRIAATLKPGAGVVTTRGHVQFIVTEFGVADLRGKTLRERAEALIHIAHPDHRAELRSHAIERRTFDLAAR